MNISGQSRGPCFRWMLLLPALALAAASSAALADDWPRQFDSDSGSFVIYEPQPETLNGDLLTGRAAFSLTKASGQSPVFGVLWFTEHVQIDRDSSTVEARNFDVTRVRLPGISSGDAHSYETLVEQQAAQWNLSGSMEELEAGLAAAEKERASVANLDNTPPRIVFSYEKAILVQYDGDPALETIEGSNLERVSNTPYAIIYDPAAGDYYLSGARLWYTSKDPVGQWRNIPAPPQAVADVTPPDTSSTDQIQGAPPVVLTATEPTELISIAGEPDFAPLVDGELLYVRNTESDVVREVSTQSLYVLLAGRWYRAPTPDGPWSYVSADGLPESFSRVPADSPKGEILASVAGTEEADDAVADAEIPQTSAIRRDSTDFQVSYDGAPQFDPVEGTKLQYALNTDAQVLLADGRYYACDQGVWYVSDQPEGPWSVSETRPLECDDIPPSCPDYDVRYVYIYEATPDFVYEGYLPGYVGCFPYDGTVVYGTGYYYRPWRSHRHYFPRPFTWGFSPHYNPWLSRWSFGYSYESGFLRPGSRRESQPRSHSGAFQRTALWFGPGGYHRPLLAADQTLLRTRTSIRKVRRAADSLPVNIYSRSTNIQRVNRTAALKPVPAVRTYPVRPVSLPNNVFAGKDGKVYQRDPGGAWTVSKGKRWVPARGFSRGSAAGGKAPTTPATAKRNVAPPAIRPFPMRVPAPSPVRLPTIRPVPPPISKDPGDLEREYQAREHVGRESPPEPTPAPRPPEVRPTPAPATPSPAQPAPAKPAPARPEPKREPPKKNANGR